MTIPRRSERKNGIVRDEIVQVLRQSQSMTIPRKSERKNGIVRDEIVQDLRQSQSRTISGGAEEKKQKLAGWLGKAEKNFPAAGREADLWKKNVIRRAVLPWGRFSCMRKRETAR